MRKLILLIALASAAVTAYADKEFRYARNQNDGYIYLTYAHCTDTQTGKDLQHVFYFYTTKNGGQIGLDGCYIYEGDAVYRARYTNGHTYIWNADDFMPIGVGR
jgi:hypothetical protein